MQEIAPKHTCTGCHACYNICPTESISMNCDEEGFLYPKIDSGKCINCWKCKKACPVIKDCSGNQKGVAYGCINNDEQTRMDSSSGGVFSLLADTILTDGGVVYGAAFDDEFNLKHICVESNKELYKLRGSKYIQSTISDTYKTAEAYLKQGRKVLFSGTPCQIGGLKAYLDHDYDNLFLVDLICHGVPSQKVFKIYLDSLKKNMNTSLSDKSEVRFRDKANGWYGYSVSVKFDGTHTYCKNKSQDAYMKAFLNNISLRPSCYNCHYKSVNRQGDITLADFWGVKQQLPEMFDNKGTSLVLVNTEKGRRIFENISDSMKFMQVDYDRALKANTAAYQSCKMPRKRKQFMLSLDTVDFKKNVESCTKPDMVSIIKKLIKRGIKYVQK